MALTDAQIKALKPEASRCPQGSRQRSVERLSHSRGEDWRLRGKTARARRLRSPPALQLP
jgi:hypothetical protein